MSVKMKNLPTGSMTFRNIIEGGFVYVDKTDLAANLAAIPFAQLFLTRPRRFGKSLFLSTIEEIFKGSPDIFTGLKIMETGYKFVEHPVVRLDMSVGSSSPAAVETNILEMINRIAIKAGVELNMPTSTSALAKLVDALYDKYDKNGVVILVDEYDAPVSSRLKKPDLAEDNSEVLRDFYASLKSLAQDGKLRFVMVTGVTRYGMMGISAGLNTLNDISFDQQYATVCGFTEDELDTHFAPFYPTALKSLVSSGDLAPGSTEGDLRDKIIGHYDGYSWDGETRVLNPFSLVRFFYKGKLEDFWAETLPSANFLADVIGQRPEAFVPEKWSELKEKDFKVNAVEQAPSPIFLFHTGYLTIDTSYKLNGKTMYGLRIPNAEVKSDFFETLAQIIYSQRAKDLRKEAEGFKKAVFARDALALNTIISAFFDGLVHKHHKENESLYHSVLWAYCKGMFEEARMEEPGSGGDLDVIITFGKSEYAIIEMKYGDNKKNVKAALLTLAQRADKSIKAKKYGKKYKLPWNNVADIGLGVYGRGETEVLFV
jgi:hypothetical protein